MQSIKRNEIEHTLIEEAPFARHVFNKSTKISSVQQFSNISDFVAKVEESNWEGKNILAWRKKFFFQKIKNLLWNEFLKI